MASLAQRAQSSACFQSLMGFFFNKGVRGGPRILLNLAAVLFGLFVFIKLLPQRVTESALSSIPISWAPVVDDYEGIAAGAPGGLRIVVFGELDVGTPVSYDQETENAQSWTQALCDKLSCTSHISMVPGPDVASFSVSSNDLYAHALEKVYNETEGKSGPGQDYSHLATYYPPQWKSSDLREQIDRFLAMPKPQHTPSETLWVVSFGSWDVFSMSALPVATATDYIGSMTKDIFTQIQRLHAASTNPESIAFSDINVTTPSENTEANETGEDDSSEADLPEGEQLEARDDAPPGQPEPVTDEAAAPPSVFRVLIPNVVDPSILPGWRDLRPDLPRVHSKAEQMRNAEALTRTWNDGIGKWLSEWIKLDEAGEDKSTEFQFDGDAVSPSTANTPLRDGFAYDIADFIVGQMLERQMVNNHLTDGDGRGTSDLEEGYRDVTNSCLQPVSKVAVAVSSESDVTINIPNKMLDNDLQVPTKPTPRAVVAKRDEAEKMMGFAYLKTAKMCDIPSDHLFYTPFALSQKAITQIADETAQMIQNGESVRSKW